MLSVLSGVAFGQASAGLSIPTVTLPGGGHLPMLNLGDGASWGRPSNFSLWSELVGKGAGMDTAWDYRVCNKDFSQCNHTQAGILPQVRAAGAVREDVFITTKIPCGAYDGGVEPINAEIAKQYVAADLSELGTSYVDLLLLHHVCRTQAETAVVWGVLEEVLRSGQAKAIGVSNFDTVDLEFLATVAKEPISVNQCQFAVGKIDTDVIAYSKAHGIALESYGTLHGSVPSSNPTIVQMAAKYNVSAQALMLKYVSQHGIAIVSASSKRAYDVEDASIFSFDLSAQDMVGLDALQSGARTCKDCYALPCRTCMKALKAAGCKPGSGADCITCAAAHSSAVWDTCGEEQPRIAKACNMG